VGIPQIDGLTHAVVGRPLQRETGIEHPPHDAAESAAVGEEHREVVEPGGARRGPRGTPARPGIQTEMVVVAARGEKHRVGPIPRRNLEAQHVAVKSERPVQVRHGQMHVPDARAGVDAHDTRINKHRFPGPAAGLYYSVMNAAPKIPTPVNEPVLSYAPGSAERADVKRALKDMSAQTIEIPVVVGGREIRTGNTATVVMPHCHRRVLATVHQAGPAEIEAAIAAAREAWRDWSTWSFPRRAAVFLKAADLLATRHRAAVNAATMLGQSKTVHQAEIDAACELIDFWRYNAFFGDQLLRNQPYNDGSAWNRLEYRPLEGFIFAVSPFNFTSIAGNLPTAPMLM